MSGLEIGVSALALAASHFIHNVMIRRHVTQLLMAPTAKATLMDNEIQVMKQSLRTVANDITLALRQQNEMKRGFATMEATVKSTRK